MYNNKSIQGFAVSAGKVTAQSGYFVGGCSLEGAETSRGLDLNPPSFTFFLSSCQAF